MSLTRGGVAISVQYNLLDLRHLIKLGGVVYSVQSVKGGDTVGLSVKVDARALEDAGDYTLMGPLLSRLFVPRGSTSLLTADGLQVRVDL